jgi:hypothetical protein
VTSAVRAPTTIPTRVVLLLAFELTSPNRPLERPYECALVKTSSNLVMKSTPSNPVTAAPLSSRTWFVALTVTVASSSARA